MKLNSNKSSKFLFLKYFVAYIAITMFFFLFGPIEYYPVSKLAATLFMSAFMIVACLAYLIGVNKRIKYRPKVILREGKEIKFNARKIIFICIIYAFILQFLVVFENMRAYGLSFSNIFIKDFFAQMAETYTDTIIINTPSSWVMSYTGWTKIIAIVGGCFYFKDFKVYEKILVAGLSGLIIINVVFFIGSQKQLIDLFVYVFIAFFLSSVCEQKKHKMWGNVRFAIILLTMVFVTGNVITARFSLWSDRYNSGIQVATGRINYDHWLYDILPGQTGFAVTQLISYLSQGYRGLSLSLQIPFEWAFGLGSSFKMMSDISRWFNIPRSLLEVSYPVRMEEQFGVGAYAYWHTIFPWIASDFTWIGSIIVVSIFIYYWAKSWNELRTWRNLPALLMFVHLTILVLYIPCNNQLFQTRESIVSTLFIFLFWFLFHGAEFTGKQKGDINHSND
jgi:hypothetical protein